MWAVPTHHYSAARVTFNHTDTLAVINVTTTPILQKKDYRWLLWDEVLMAFCWQRIKACLWHWIARTACWQTKRCWFTYESKKVIHHGNQIICSTLGGKVGLNHKVNLYKARANQLSHSWFHLISKADWEKLESSQKLCPRVTLPNTDQCEDKLALLSVHRLNIHLDINIMLPKIVSVIFSRISTTCLITCIPHPIRQDLNQISAHSTSSTPSQDNPW